MFNAFSGNFWIFNPSDYVFTFFGWLRKGHELQNLKPFCN